MNTKPLQGKKIAVTRAKEQSQDFLEALAAQGAEAINIPAITIAPASDTALFDEALANIHMYDWLIATSINGVEALAARMNSLGMSALPPTLMIGAIGPATSAAFRKYHIEPAFVPDRYVAEGILAEIPPVLGKRIVLPRADIARDTLAAGLRDRGALVTEISAYQTVPGNGAHRLLQTLQDGVVDIITFTSSSTVRYLLQGLHEQGIGQSHAIALLNTMHVAVIGPITGRTAQEIGLNVAIEAQTYTTDGLIDAMIAFYENTTSSVIS